MLPQLSVSRLTVPRLSGHDYSNIIEARFVEICRILHVSAMKLHYDCFTCLRNLPTARLAGVGLGDMHCCLKADELCISDDTLNFIFVLVT